MLTVGEKAREHKIKKVSLIWKKSPVLFCDILDFYFPFSEENNDPPPTTDGDLELDLFRDRHSHSMLKRLSDA